MPRPTLDCFTVDTSGWILVADGPTRRGWQLENGDGVSVDLVKRPGIYLAPDDTEELRWMALEMVTEMNDGFVEVGCLEVDGRPALRVISKSTLEDSCRFFMGWIIVPFKRSSFFVNVSCGEYGITGAREALIFDRLRRSGEVGIPGAGITEESDGEIEGWIVDDLDGRLTPGQSRNRSEDPVYDDEFPDHPLTRVRQLLGHIAMTGSLAASLKSRPAFRPGAFAWRQR